MNSKIILPEARNGYRTALFLIAIVTSISVFGQVLGAAQRDPLPSWNDGEAKTAIIQFVDRVTKDGTDHFVPPAERIAVFDNDGTLWCEQPMYVQLAFAIDRVKALAPEHPEWKSAQPFKAILDGDLKAITAEGESGIAKLLAATHAGMSVDDFHTIVREWIESTKNPITGKRYVDMVYQPMLELLSHLRANGFKTYIVSGGGVEFMRPWTERVYGIPPEQVVGSRGKLKFELQAGTPIILKLPEIDLVDDGPGKPVGIAQAISRRPVMAFGNSDGDLQMLQWTTISRDPNDQSPRFGLIVHHTDAAREFAYDRDSRIGRLDKALDEAKSMGWIVASMKDDWKTIWKAEMFEGKTVAGKWRVDKIAGQAVGGDATPTIEITMDGKISGDTGVNRFSGVAAIDGEKISIGPLATTRRAGPPALMEQEVRFTKALQSAASFQIDGEGRLALDDKEGNELLQLSPSNR